MKLCSTPGACSLASHIREAMPWANHFELAVPSQLVALRELLEHVQRRKPRCDPRRWNNPGRPKTPLRQHA
jgi:hypothetical protein